jgi:hypothetical protein
MHSLIGSQMFAQFGRQPRVDFTLQKLPLHKFTLFMSETPPVEDIFTFEISCSVKQLCGQVHLLYFML